MNNQDNFKNAILELKKFFNDEMDGQVYMQSFAYILLRYAKQLANYLSEQDTMPRDHIFNILQEHVPAFAKEVSDIYQELTDTEINFNDLLMSGYQTKH